MINTLSESASLMKNQSHDKLILSHSDISSLRNKSVPLTLIIDNNIDILLIPDTKLDDLFLLTKFKDLYFPYRQDRNHLEELNRILVNISK